MLFWFNTINYECKLQYLSEYKKVNAMNIQRPLNELNRPWINVDYWNVTKRLTWKSAHIFKFCYKCIKTKRYYIFIHTDFNATIYSLFFSEICDSHTQDILNSFDNEGYLDKSKALATINLFKCGNWTLLMWWAIWMSFLRELKKHLVFSYNVLTLYFYSCCILYKYWGIEEIWDNH